MQDPKHRSHMSKQIKSKNTTGKWLEQKRNGQRAGIDGTQNGQLEVRSSRNLADVVPGAKMVGQMG